MLAAAAVGMVLSSRSKRCRKIGAIYARYSKRDQHSIEDQVRACLDWAAANGFDVPDDLIFSDRAVTGRSSRRHGLAALQQALEDGRFDVLIVFTTNRLFRRTYKSLAFVEEEIVDRGLRCVFIRSGVDTADEGRWRQLLQLHGMIDEFIIEMTAHHVRAAHEGLLLQMRVFGTVTFGYGGEVIEGILTRLGRPAKRLVIDEETAAWVRRIFQWFIVEGLTIAAIVRRMNALGAPLPPRSFSGRWTRLAVRRILQNERYIGNWAYGRTKTVWMNKKNYARAVEREKPLKEVRLDALRILDDQTWQKAQERLTDLAGNAGRQPKDGDRKRRPRVLNGFFKCQKHKKRPLEVDGPSGRYMRCRECRESDEPALFSLLPRKLALELICARLAALIRDDTHLCIDVIDATKRLQEQAARPDEGRLAEIRREISRLNDQIEFILDAPGETAVDRQENKQHLADLRKRRAALLREEASLEDAAKNPGTVPDQSQIRQAVEDIERVLLWASASDDPAELSAVREVVELMTGGRILLTQMGEQKQHKGWLRATFTASTAKPVLDRLGIACDVERAVEITIDICRESLTDVKSEEVKALLDQGFLKKEIAQRMEISPARISQLWRHWFTKRGLPVQDGRTRRKELAVKQTETPKFRELGADAWKLAEEGLPDTEIAERFGVSDTTVRNGIEDYCRTHGLPVPMLSRRRAARLEKALALIDEGMLVNDAAKELGYSARGLKLALDRHLAAEGRRLPDGRSRRGNARSGQKAQHPEVFCLVDSPEKNQSG